MDVFSFQIIAAELVTTENPEADHFETTRISESLSEPLRPKWQLGIICTNPKETI